MAEFKLEGTVVKRIFNEPKANGDNEDFIVIKTESIEVGKGKNKGKKFSDYYPILVKQPKWVKEVKEGDLVVADVKMKSFKWDDAELKVKTYTWDDGGSITSPQLFPKVELAWSTSDYCPLRVLQPVNSERVESNQEVEKGFRSPSIPEDDLPF